MDGDADKRARLRTTMDDALSNLMAVLPGADNEPGWDIPTADEGWTVRQLLAHLAGAEVSMNGLIARAVAAGRAGESASTLAPTTRDGRPFDLDFWNRRQIEKRAEQPPSALRLELTEARAKNLRDLKALAPEELTFPAWHPTLGDTTVEGIYKIIGLHMRDHTRSIKKALREGLQGRYWADRE